MKTPHPSPKSTVRRSVSFAIIFFAIDTLGNVKWSWEEPFSKEEGRITGLHRSALPAGLYWVRFYQAGRSWV